MYKCIYYTHTCMMGAQKFSVQAKRKTMNQMCLDENFSALRWGDMQVA